MTGTVGNLFTWWQRVLRSKKKPPPTKKEQAQYVGIF
jgi:hypothetical protein